MSLPKTTRVYRRTQDGKSIELLTEDLPSSLAATQVLLKIHAVTLNSRDVAMIDGHYFVPVTPQGVPCSDAAATVVAVGSSVTGLKEGDYVTPSFMLNYLHSRDKSVKPASLGGDVDGVLREYAIFEQQFLTKIPEHLSYEEGSTIACAGVTAWTSLDFHAKSTAIESALMLGTGGVSMFAVLLCLAAGITPIITSSSDEKLEQVKALGTKDKPVLGFNHRTHAEWAAEVQRLTDNAGVDCIVNNVGYTAMEQSYAALAPRDGTISLVGFLGGLPDKMPDMVMPTMMKKAKIQ